jgi:lipopolysaccharide transport system permease protein
MAVTQAPPAELIAASVAATLRAAASGEYVTVIEPNFGRRLSKFRKLARCRDLLWYLALRSIKIRYAQSVAKLEWIIVQPAPQIGMFTLVVGRLGQIATDGVPHAAFYPSIMVALTYFANGLISATDGLIGNANAQANVYLPRLMLPHSAPLAAIFDFAIALLLSLCAFRVFSFCSAVITFMLPLLIILTANCEIAVNLWTSALTIKHRNTKHVMEFVVQLLTYGIPVFYPASGIPTALTWGGLSINAKRLYAFTPKVRAMGRLRAAFVSSWPMTYGRTAVVG